MAQTDTRSVEQIRRDAERARANLTDTVHQLRETVSDAAGDVRQRLSVESITNDLIETARRNPLQAAAVGALAAWPALRLVKSIPLPILMIGAGLFLTGTKSGQELSRKAADKASDLADDARDRAQGLTEAAQGITEAAKENVAQLTDKAARVAEDLRAKARDAAGQAHGAAAKAQDVAGKAADAVSHAAERVSALASDVVAAAPSPSDVAGVVAVAREGLGAARETIRNAPRNAVSSADEALAWVKANPVLVAGAALAVGGFVASALPPTIVERSVAGSVSGAVRSAARQGVNAAVGTAALAAVDLARRAAKEGFDPERIARAAHHHGEPTEKVAAATDAAAGEPPAGGQRQS